MDSAAAAARVSSSWITACWNEANRSSVCFGVTASHCSMDGCGWSAEHGFAGGDFVVHMARLHPAQDGGFVAAEAEIQRIALHFGEGEVDGAGVAVGREAVDDGTAGVAEAEEFADLVEGFAGGIVAGLAEQAVGTIGADLEQVGMAAAGHQGEGRELDGRPSRRDSRMTAWMWPSIWLTPMSGTPVAKLRLLA